MKDMATTTEQHVDQQRGAERTCACLSLLLYEPFRCDHLPVSTDEPMRKAAWASVGSNATERRLVRLEALSPLPKVLQGFLGFPMLLAKLSTPNMKIGDAGAGQLLLTPFTIIRRQVFWTQIIKDPVVAPTQR